MTIMTIKTAEHPLRTMSARDLANWGLEDLAFVHRVTDEEEGSVWGIFAADGTRIGTAPERDVAFAAIRQHDLEPHDVH